jgi:prepilin-type processing-associated H-X9-DG protein
VQKVREAAARLQCQNNLKQIGLAMYNFESTYKYFPTCGANTGGLGVPASQVGFETMGWEYQILAFLEQDALYKIGQVSGPFGGNVAIGKAMVEVPVTVYLCPSRSDRLSLPAPWGSQYAMGDYAGVILDFLFTTSSGFAPYATEQSQTFMGMITKGGHVRTDNPSLTQKFGYVRVSGGVPDGLSNTIAVMEKAVSAQYYSPRYTDQWEVYGWATGADWPNMRVAGNGIPLLADNQARPQAWITQGNGRPFEYGFGSPHSGVVNALFGDGSVRTLSQSLDPCGTATNHPSQCILYLLGHRADGVPFTIPD